MLLIFNLLQSGYYTTEPVASRYHAATMGMFVLIIVIGVIGYIVQARLEHVFKKYSVVAFPGGLTAAEEAVIEFEEIDDTPSMFAALKTRMGELLKLSKDKEGKDAAHFAELGEMIEDLAEHSAKQAEAFTKAQAAHEQLQAAHTKLAGEFADLLKRLGDIEDHSQQQRPPVTGGNGQTKAEV